MNAEGMDDVNTLTPHALSALVEVKGPERQQALDDFYSRWKNDPLVVLKWLGLQAMSNAPGNVNLVRPSGTPLNSVLNLSLPPHLTPPSPPSPRLRPLSTTRPSISTTPTTATRSSWDSPGPPSTSIRLTAAVTLSWPMPSSGWTRSTTRWGVDTRMGGCMEGGNGTDHVTKVSYNFSKMSGDHNLSFLLPVCSLCHCARLRPAWCLPSRPTSSTTPRDRLL